jgi:hypothetical protein
LNKRWHPAGVESTIQLHFLATSFPYQIRLDTFAVFKRPIAMNLRPRFLLITALLVIASAAAAWYASRQLAENIVAQWAVRYAEKQVLYDKSRLLQPIVREMALSRQFAASQELRNWARNPEDPKLLKRALTEMESFRLNFADRS